VCIGLSVFIVCLLILILVPISFHYVEYDQYALKKSVTNSKVDYSKVYDYGQYAWGPSYTTVTFPKLYQFVDFSGAEALSVFTLTKAQITIEVSFQYRLDRNHLVQIFQSYGTGFDTQVQNVARSTIKNAAPIYDVGQYFTNRANVTLGLATALEAGVSGLWVTVPSSKFQLHSVVFADVVTNKYLQQQIQVQATLQTQAEQNSTLYRQETANLISNYTYQTNIIYSQNAANASLLVSNANADAFRIRQSAEGIGLTYLFLTLGITDQGLKRQFLTLYRSESNNSTRGLFNIGSASVLLN